MGKKRMFSLSVTDTDKFLEMPTSTQALYFHLSMHADDDGFVSNPKAIQRIVGASPDDLKILESKQYIIVFGTGVIVIRHWRINNYLRGDRYTPTTFTEEKSKLEIEENGSYQLSGIPSGVPVVDHVVYQTATNGIPVVDHVVYQTATNGIPSIDKYSIDKNSIDKDRGKPTLEELKAYCKERKNNVDPEKFFDYYSSNGWKVGKNPMKDWKAAVRTWERNDYKGNPKKKEALPDYYTPEPKRTEEEPMDQSEAEELMKMLKG